MIEERAVVVALLNQGGVEVESAGTTAACAGCVRQGGCGVSMIGRLLGKRRTRAHLAPGVHVEVGDIVVVGLDERALVAGALATFALPIVGMLAGAVGGAIVADWATADHAGRDLFALVGSILGFGAALRWFPPAVLARYGSEPLVTRSEVRRCPPTWSDDDRTGATYDGHRSA